jgi:hypothetical protein
VNKTVYDAATKAVRIARLFSVGGTVGTVNKNKLIKQESIDEKDEPIDEKEFLEMKWKWQSEFNKLLDEEPNENNESTKKKLEEIIEKISPPDESVKNVNDEIERFYSSEIGEIVEIKDIDMKMLNKNMLDATGVTLEEIIELEKKESEKNAQSSKGNSAMMKDTLKDTLMGEVPKDSSFKFNVKSQGGRKKTIKRNKRKYKRKTTKY